MLPLSLILAACTTPPEPVVAGEGGRAGNSPPTEATAAANRAVLEALPFGDRRDFEDAARGLIATADDLTVTHPRSGEVIWDQPAFAFLHETDATEAPSNVNPSLWRQAQLNGTAGLYEVTDGVYQLRNFDLSTWSVIRGETGWIVVDPGTSRETAERALAFLRAHLLRDDPITAVLFTHSHIDHFGGALAVASPEDQQAGRVLVVAPEGFIEEATSENVLLGNAMARRAGYQYGRVLAPGPYGHVDLGLGKAVPFGSPAILTPDLLIREDGEEYTIDGVRFVFEVASGTEAPAEFMFFLPDKNAFCGAEVVSRTMHNLYTLRGAKVRDALLWAAEIDGIRQRYADVDVVFNSHHWPIWGRDQIREYLDVQRDTYRFIHDQTVRMLLNGLGPDEIASTIALPPALKRHFFNQGYYGTVEHNARAVYQFYMGWYDANPARLHPLPRPEAAKRYVALMGGVDAVVSAGQAAHGEGDYRWAAELLNHAVFADPDHAGARELLAKTYDQLGYQAESGPWRSVYLVGAHELRHGVTVRPVDLADYRAMLTLTPTRQFLQTLTVRLDAEAAAGKEVAINIAFTDTEERFVLELRNAVLHVREDARAPDADASLTLTRALFLDIITQAASLRELATTDQLQIDGSTLSLLGFFGMLDALDPAFPIVTP